MQAILNTFMKSELSPFNGLTFDIVGHSKGKFIVDICGINYLLPGKEILIVNIERELTQAKIRDDTTFCDYWYKILSNYCKDNKININATFVNDSEPIEVVEETTELIIIEDKNVFYDSEIV